MSPPAQLSRRNILAALAGTSLGSAAFGRALAAQVEAAGEVTADMIAQAEWVADIELDAEERDGVARAVQRLIDSQRDLRSEPIDADLPPAITFRPDALYDQAEPAAAMVTRPPPAWSPLDPLPSLTDEALAFASIHEQASLLATGRLSSVELTRMYLRRIKTYDPLLHCVVTLLEDHALHAARESDQRRQRQATLGILDGIPWLAKDLIAVPPWKTTWGAAPFQDQVRPAPATVFERLQRNGAVLLAKVSVGALAWGDRWFGGMTRNPWNPQQGSSGSSAGSAAGVAAGLASFALGSETLGSIVSPCRRCRTSGLRPTFGRVSRAGCMPLAWSMDKIGPIARWVDDLPWVFSTLLGPDPADASVVDRGFRWPSPVTVNTLRVGITPDRLNSDEQAAVEFFRAQGATLVDLDLKTELPVSALSFILGAEATTVFDDAFRRDQHADYGRWPATFRESQFTTAVHYLRANRLRSQLVIETEQGLRQVDVVVGGNDLLLTNLTGHPSLMVACGSSPEGDQPGIVKLTGAAYREELLLVAGRALQAGLPPRPAQPPLDRWLEQANNDAGDAP